MERNQLIRHTTANANAFIGLHGELTVDYDKLEIRVHNGVIAGGYATLRSDFNNVVSANLLSAGVAAGLARATEVYTKDIDRLIFNAGSTEFNAAQEEIDFIIDSVNVTDAVILSGVNDYLTINITSEFTDVLKVDTINESTADAGVTIEGVIVADSAITADSLHVGVITEKTADAGVVIEGVGFLNSVIFTDTVSELSDAAGVTIDGVELKDGGITLDGELIGVDNTVSQVMLKDIGYINTTVAASGSTETLDLVNGNSFDITLTDDCVFTFSNPPAAGTLGCFVLIMRQDGTGSHIPSWPASVDWGAATEPTWSTDADSVDIINFITVDGGTTWLGWPIELGLA